MLPPVFLSFFLKFYDLRAKRYLSYIKSLCDPKFLLGFEDVGDMADVRSMTSSTCLSDTDSEDRDVFDRTETPQTDIRTTSGMVRSETEEFTSALLGKNTIPLYLILSTAA